MTPCPVHSLGPEKLPCVSDHTRYSGHLWVTGLHNEGGTDD